MSERSGLGGVAPRGVGLRHGNPMARAVLSLLVFDVIVAGLAIPGMIWVSSVPVWAAVTAGVVGMVLALGAAVAVSRADSYLLGWVTHVYLVLLGLGSPMMYVVGAVFLVIWIAAIVLGRRLEAEDR